MTVEKGCTRCHMIQPLDAFSLNGKGKDGRHSWCKTCVVAADTTGTLRKRRQRAKAAKVCTICLEEKPASAFGINNGSLRPACKPCRSKAEHEKHAPWNGAAASDGAWRERAACRDKPPEWWFPPPKEQYVKTEMTAEERMARAICAACPVKESCLDVAAELGTSLVGIWGGLDEKQRRNRRRKGSRSRAS